MLPLGETGLVPLTGEEFGVGFGTPVCVLRRGREFASCEAETARPYRNTAKIQTKTMSRNFIGLILLMSNR